VFKVLAFIINLAVVIYLLLAKRLFGVRGGVAANEAEAARDRGWTALERTELPPFAPLGAAGPREPIVSARSDR
jgi:hypothetical protein